MNMGLINSAIVRKDKTESYIRSIADRLKYVDMDMPDNTIADQLNKMGIKTRMGGNWGNVAVKRMKKILEIK